MFVSLEPTARLMLPEVREIQLVLVEVGGTGSHLAGSLGSILVHSRSKGVNISLTLFDPDIIEEKISADSSSATLNSARIKR